MTTAVAVIPARLESTRFPRKALASETGLPLIIHVAQQAAQSRHLDDVIIASDAEEILAAARAHGFNARQTRADHSNGTSRIAEIAEDLDCELIVNVQADEPEIDPGVIDAAIEALEAAPDCPVGTIASPWIDGDDPADANLVKVALNDLGRARCFSRIPIPPAPGDRPGMLKHVGLYVYQRAFLPVYTALEPTAGELQEKLEQLRILEHGHQIAVAVRDCQHQGIDTPQQYQAFVSRHFERTSQVQD